MSIHNVGTFVALLPYNNDYRCFFAHNSRVGISSRKEKHPNTRHIGLDSCKLLPNVFSASSFFEPSPQTSTV